MTSFLELFTSGLQTDGDNICEIIPSLFPIVLALLMSSMSFLIFLLCRIGTSDMNSTPPAIATSIFPDAIKPTAEKYKTS